MLIMNSCNASQVGRPREFNEEQVLDAVREVFWEKGFDGASLADLTLATGLHKGSLYKAFGDKKKLFLLTLQRYMDVTFAEMHEAASKHDSPLDSLKAVLEQMTDTATGHSDCPRGCMVINTIVEYSDGMDEAKEIIDLSYQQRIEFLSGLVEKSQQTSQIADPRSAELLAMMTLTFMAGLAAIVKGPIDSDQARLLINEFLKNWT